MNFKNTKMKIYTSYYGNLKNLQKANIVPVAISIGTPRYFNGDRLKYLAPTREMLSLNEAEYTPKYLDILNRINLNVFRHDIAKVSNKNEGKDIALLCYEKPGDFCHRFLFADWLEKKTGYKIEEFNFLPEAKKQINKQTEMIFAH